MNLPAELKNQITAHLDEVRKYLGNLPADERQEILQSIESHIHDALEIRSNGAPTPALLDAGLAEMDPPDSYGELPGLPQKRQSRRRLVLTLCGLAMVALAAAGIREWKNIHPNIIKQWSSDEKITEGVGIADFRIGASKKQLLATLGAPDAESTETRLQWKNLHIHTLTDESRGAFELRFDVGFPWTTAKGIKIGSPETDVLAAYGKPEHIIVQGEAKKLEWSNQGILVWLTPENGVHQIVIFRPYASSPSPEILLADYKADLTGHWESVDFVSSIEQFDPETKSWRGDLYLKELTFLPDGKTDRPFWTWKGNVLHHSGEIHPQKHQRRGISVSGMDVR